MTGPAQTQDLVLRELQSALGHVFSDPALLIRALSHRSTGAANNERLEFLGDSLLNFVIANALYTRCPDASEGDLSRLRASLVRGVTLAEIAATLELGGALRLGGGERASAGHRRASILADTVEALLGAVLQDAGFEAARSVILGLYAERFDQLPSAESLKDPKTRLQEALQSVGLDTPNYSVLDVTGPIHKQRFTAVCETPDGTTAKGTGTSRRKAEQAAASAVLDKRKAGAEASA